MPLPLIPVLIGGAALLAGGYGVKKGLDAKENFDRAKDISADAQRIYDDAVERLEDVREETQASLEDLGRKKISIHKKFLLPFIETAQKINYSIIKEDPQNRFVVKTSFELAKTVSNILKTPLFDDSGAVTRELRTLLRKNTSFLRQLALM